MRKLTDTISRRDLDAVLAFYACGLYDDGGKLAKEALATRKAAKRKRAKAKSLTLAMVPRAKVSKSARHAAH